MFRTSIKHIVVTGGAGFIGSHFIRHLFLAFGEQIRVTNIDNLSYAGNLDNTASYQNNKNYCFVKADIVDKDFLEKHIFSNFEVDVVVNFAAESHVDRSILDSRPFILSNVLGTQVLLDLSRQYKVKKFIQISTDEVYGSLGSEGLFSETMPLSPNSPYSASKAAADLLAMSYWHTYQLPICITRCSNNYGPNQFPEKLIPLAITKAMNDECIPVYGSGENIRDWIHVDDHCAGVLSVLNLGEAGEVYNFGAHSEIKNIEIVKKILSILGKPETLINFVTDRLGHDFRYAIDNTKSINTLGWKPTIKLEKGLLETVIWYKSRYGEVV